MLLTTLLCGFRDSLCKMSSSSKHPQHAVCPLSQSLFLSYSDPAVGVVGCACSGRCVVSGVQERNRPARALLVGLIGRRWSDESVCGNRFPPEVLEGTKDKPVYDVAESPMIAFINARSGGRSGPELLTSLHRALGNAQVPSNNTRKMFNIELY